MTIKPLGEDGNIMLMNCPDCNATFMLHGDFYKSKGQIIRASDTPYYECEKCLKIHEVVGFGGLE